MRKWRLALIVVLLCGVMVGGRMIASAQDAPEPGASESGVVAAPDTAGDAGGGGDDDKEIEQRTVKGESVLTMVLKHSGIAGWTIILMSLVAMGIIARFTYHLRRPMLLPEQLIRQLQDDLDNGQVREAVQKCNASESVLARVMKAALLEIRGGYDEMSTVMQEAGEAESVRQHQQVGWLAVIGAIAPMLGLTGTVLGMMGAFGVIAASEGNPSARELAEHIQLALTTTCEGLLVAVPVLLAYAVFRNRVTSLMLDVGVISTELIGRFKGVEITPAMIAGVREAATDGGEGYVPPSPPVTMAPEVDDDDGAPPPPPPPQ